MLDASGSRDPMIHAGLGSRNIARAVSCVAHKTKTCSRAFAMPCGHHLAIVVAGFVRASAKAFFERESHAVW